MQTPVGYDLNSYSYRDVNGAAFHESLGKEYGQSYGEGDVVGCLLTMGDPPAARRERQRVNIKGVEYIVEEVGHDPPHTLGHEPRAAGRHTPGSPCLSTSLQSFPCSRC